MLALSLALCGSSLVGSAAEGAASQAQEFALREKAVALADFLVKEGAADKFACGLGTCSDAFAASGVAASSLDYSALARRLGARSACGEVVSGSKEFSCSGEACALRPVAVREGGVLRRGYLHACVS
jgi:hypothetical protein